MFQYVKGFTDIIKGWKVLKDSRGDSSAVLAPTWPIEGLEFDSRYCLPNQPWTPGSGCTRL